MTPATTLIGVGLIGGSLALDLRRLGLSQRIIGVGRSPDNLNLALKRGIIDEASGDLAQAVKGAELVILATPVAAAVEQIAALAPLLSPGALVIDVGSVKAPIARAGADLMRQGRFVPCHPVAGTEESGAGAAREGLFTGAKCILTPDDATPGAAVERAQRIWELAGATAARMTPEEHDVAFARVSHLPHLAAYALVDYLQGLPGWRHHAPLAGSGFRDFTRIAGSPAEVWLDIARLNRENLAELLAGAAEAVRQAAGWVRDGRWEELRGLMERARQAKKDMRNQS